MRLPLPPLTPPPHTNAPLQADGARHHGAQRAQRLAQLRNQPL